MKAAVRGYFAAAGGCDMIQMHIAAEFKMPCQQIFKRLHEFGDAFCIIEPADGEDQLCGRLHAKRFACKRCVGRLRGTVRPGYGNRVGADARDLAAIAHRPGFVIYAAFQCAVYAVDEIDAEQRHPSPLRGLARPGAGYNWGCRGAPESGPARRPSHGRPIRCHGQSMCRRIHAQWVQAPKRGHRQAPNSAVHRARRSEHRVPGLTR